MKHGRGVNIEELRVERDAPEELLGGAAARAGGRGRGEAGRGSFAVRGVGVVEVGVVEFEVVLLKISVAEVALMAHED